MNPMENPKRHPDEIAHSIIATAIDGFLMLDAATLRLFDTNDAYARMVGYTKEELLSMSLFDLEVVEKSEVTKGRIAHILKSGGDRFESRHRTKDGRTIDVEISARWLDIDGGRIVAFLRDATDRKKTEAELRVHEERFRAIVQSTPDAIVTADSRQVIVGWNKGAEGIFGYSEREILGRPLVTLIPERYRQAHLSGVERYLATHKPHLIGKTIEVRGLRKNGDEFPLELSLSAWQTADDIFFTAIIRDVSERKQAERERYLLLAVTTAIAKAENLDEVLNAVLRLICENTGWVLGEVWMPKSDGSCLELHPSWHSNVLSLASFRRKSADFTFTPGVGLPGRVWISKKPAWIKDVTGDSNFPRAAVAREFGLRAAMGIPILAGDEVIAVMEFYVFEPREEDERQIQLVSAVAVQLGSLIHRKEVEDSLRLYNDELKRLNKVMMGREVRIIELKQEVAQLKAKLGETT